MALFKTRSHSIAGLLNGGKGLLGQRLFRSPHHATSETRPLGAGSGVPRPGEGEPSA
jgi:magnesium chelatase family protein